MTTGAKVNTKDNFEIIFSKMLEGLFIDRMEGNEAIFTKLMSDPQFQDVAVQHLLEEVYARIRSK